MPAMDKSFRLLDFNIYDNVIEKELSSGSESDHEYQTKRDMKHFTIQMFGINETGETFSVFGNDYKPFFYVKVDDNWTIDRKTEFLSHLKKKVGKYYENSICDCKIIKRHKLYGFDAGKEYKFVQLKFNNTSALNKVKNLYYENGQNGRRLMHNGYVFQDTHIWHSEG